MMKFFKSAQSLFTSLVFLIVVSCSEEQVVKQETGQFHVSFSERDIISGGRTKQNIDKLLISIRNAHGTAVIENKVISLYKFGNEYISEALSLPTGQYQLSQFIVLNEEDEAVYATPLEGSPLAYLVDDPLPIDFSITKDLTTKVTASVIDVADYTPGDFGYVTFSFEVINTLNFSIAAMAYNELSHNFELTEAHFYVTTEDDTLFNKELPAITNSIRIRDGYGNYTVKVTKDGYTTYQKDYTTAELKQFSSKNVLVITLKKETSVNGAIFFDGVDDYLDLGNIYDDVQLPVSISAWVFVESDKYTYLFTSQDNSPLYNGFTLGISNHQIGVGYGDGRGENNNLYRRDKGADFETINGEWFHITGVIKGALDMDLYVNGINIGGYYQGLSSYPMASSFPEDVAKVGYYYSNGLLFNFKGKLDELKIWNKALTSEEVKETMFKKSTSTEPGLIGYWNFDEASGATVFDQSSNHYHGQIKGNAERIHSTVPIHQ